MVAIHMARQTAEGLGGSGGFGTGRPGAWGLGAGGRSPGSAAALLASAGLAWRRWQTRRDLLDADTRTLADLGVTPSQARREAGRWFWDGGRG